MNQIDTPAFILAGVGIIFVLVLIRLFGRRRHATDEPAPQSYLPGQAHAGMVSREPRPVFEDRRLVDERNAPHYAVHNGRGAEPAIPLPARLSDANSRYEGRYPPRNGEGYSMSSSRGTAVAPADVRPSSAEPVRFREDQVSGLRSRWGTIQSQFVDDPRESVEEADQLVSEAVDQLHALLALERAHLRDGWETQGEVPTDELRSALRGYRSLFERLLAA